MPAVNVRTGRERTQRLEARITRNQKLLLRRAAEIEGRTLTDFVIHAAAAEARRVLERSQTIRLTRAEQAALVQALLRPPAPGPKLRAAARHYRKTMGA